MSNALRRIVRRLGSPLSSEINAKAAARFRRLEKHLHSIESQLERNAFLSAAPLVTRNRDIKTISSLADAEFKVFSQWGEDGIVQYLVHHISIPNKVFVEFGVEDYREANTRFLLIQNNWEGLIIDSNPDLAKYLSAQELYWRYNLNAKTSFITAENINELIREAGIEGDIGLLSIDIDGNDYWVWKAMEVISPRIVICEYNSVFGVKHQITVPYQPDFDKTRHHYSNLCFGASLPAICRLAEEKGYQLVGSNAAGCNAFFVRQDLAEGLPKPTVNQAYVASRFRSSVNESGELTFLGGRARIDAIRNARVLDLLTGQIVRIRDLGEM